MAQRDETRPAAWLNIGAGLLVLLIGSGLYTVCGWLVSEFKYHPWLVYGVYWTIVISLAMIAFRLAFRHPKPDIVLKEDPISSALIESISIVQQLNSFRVSRTSRSFLTQDLDLLNLYHDRIPENLYIELGVICEIVHVALCQAIKQSGRDVQANDQRLRIAFLAPKTITSGQFESDNGKLGMFVMGTSDPASVTFVEREYFLEGNGFAWHCWMSRNIQCGGPYELDVTPLAGKIVDPRWYSKHRKPFPGHDIANLVCIPVFDPQASHLRVGVLSIDASAEGLLPTAGSVGRSIQQALDPISVEICRVLNKWRKKR
jgi:hypothetical protein